jgi:hypothetical protein
MRGVEIRPEQMVPPVQRAIVMIDVVRPLTLPVAAMSGSAP